MSTISVIIPTYNRADLLVRTVASVLDQTRPADEIIIVDDGSRDDTAAVCRSLPSAVRYVWQENTGLPGARNRGIAEAKGDWIALCDSDDLWYPHKLEYQLAVLAALPDAACCLTDCIRIDGNDAPIAGDRSGFEGVFGAFGEHGLRPGEYFSEWLNETAVELGGRRSRVYYGDAFAMLFRGNIALPSSALIARSVFDAVGLFDESFRVAEETEFFHRLAAHAPIAILMEPLVGYRVGHASIVSTGTVRLIENALESNRLASLLRPLNETERAEKDAGKRRLQRRLARARLSFLDRAGARAAALDALKDVRSADLAALLAATWLPLPALRGMHRAKRLMRALRAGSQS